MRVRVLIVRVQGRGKRVPTGGDGFGHEVRADLCVQVRLGKEGLERMAGRIGNLIAQVFALAITWESLARLR
jgi:hypothetical protein